MNGEWLNHLYVAPNFQGIGIGGSLLAIAKNLSPTGLQLWTFQENHYARKFYRDHGFVEMEATDGSRNEERTPDVRLIWPSYTGVNPTIA
ncbi:putative acetyltransferase [mine drainage metagenome]|uniref:Putative acetyltransferase n=1 Tax=mine drainage metagenome TaxID=410659 RepID=A0A1J5Q020_9ZZZZ